MGRYPANKLIHRGPILERIKLSPRRVVCGISSSFPELFPTRGQVTHVLLTRPPLYSSPEGNFLVRLACVRRAASVDSEPGSNSRVKRTSPSLAIERLAPPEARSDKLVESSPDQNSKLDGFGLRVQPNCQRSVSLGSLPAPSGIPKNDRPKLDSTAKDLAPSKKGSQTPSLVVKAFPEELPTSSEPAGPRALPAFRPSAQPFN